jgi:extracellular matrix regulatory protein A
MRLINIGFGNMIAAERIVAVVSPDSAPVKRLVQEARDAGNIVNATQGRRTRAVIVTDSRHVVLSAIQPETVASRAGGREAVPQTEEKEI